MTNPKFTIDPGTVIELTGPLPNDPTPGRAGIRGTVLEHNNAGKGEPFEQIAVEWSDEGKAAYLPHFILPTDPWIVPEDAPNGLSCVCTATPFSDVGAVGRHAEQWGCDDDGSG